MSHGPQMHGPALILLAMALVVLLAYRVWRRAQCSRVRRAARPEASGAAWRDDGPPGSA
ncbi:MAG: hypothetical protein ACRD2W_06610 [Acidimicrobiales bacterium]